MRPIRNINDNWTFIRKDSREIVVNLPHTWNAFDGSDGGNDYFRGKCVYKKNIGELRKDKDEIFIIEFQGVCLSCDVYVNDFLLGHHDGGFSTFRFLLDDILLRQKENIIKVEVTNQRKENVYPLNPDFTVYGGIFRDVNIITTNVNHFNIIEYGSLGVDIHVFVNNKLGVVETKPFIIGKGTTRLTILNDKGDVVNKVDGTRIEVSDPHLWDGLNDPYLYTLQIDLLINEKIVDQVNKKIGFRDYSIIPNKGFYLNGRSYPLRGVSFTSDREGLGNAITKLNIEEDVRTLKELGANSVKLCHYQHDEYLLDLCDKIGIIVTSEIPLQKEFLAKGNDNILSQLKELTYQHKHHPSIFFWNLANDLPLSKENYADVEDLIKVLNSICKAKDPYRDTLLENRFSLSKRYNINKITDDIIYNIKLDDVRVLFKANHAIFTIFHLLNTSKPIAFNCDGTEGLINLHSNHPIKANNTEEYQLLHNIDLVKYLGKKDWVFASYFGPLFDYADDKLLGHKPGINCKGLITYDHKFKKDSFYLYKAYWSKDPFIHICGKHYSERKGPITTIRIITNEDAIEVKINDGKFKKYCGKKVYSLSFIIKDRNSIVVRSENCEDYTTFIKKNK